MCVCVFLSSYGFTEPNYLDYLDYPILIDGQVACSGVETMFSECFAMDWNDTLGMHDCSHLEDLRIQCLGKKISYNKKSLIRKCSLKATIT